MNYYLDFDSTLYDTPRLSRDMLDTIAKEICLHTDKDFEEILKELKSMFNRDNIYNIYKLAKYFASKYNIDEKGLIDKVEAVISDGEKYVFEDSIYFLKELKNRKHILNVLTYVVQEDLSYQLSKIKGSGLSEYFDNIIITSSLKFNLDLKYEEGAFFDDSPRDLTGLASRNPKVLVRVNRKNNKYFDQKLEINNLIECETLKDYIQLK